MPVEDFPEPYHSLLAFIGDLHEQVDIQISITSAADALAVLAELKRLLEASGLVVREMAKLR